MVSVIHVCLAVTLATSCLAAPRRDLGHIRHWPSLVPSISGQGNRPGVQHVYNQIITAYTAVNNLDNLDYDELLALLEEYFKGR